MSACDNKLRSNLVEAMKLDEQKLEAEMQGVTPHVFSEVHEQKMEKLLRRQERIRKVRGVLRYAVAVCLVLLLTGSILIISSEDLKASKLSVDIIEWLEEFFSVEKGEDDKRKVEEVLFREEQIGYLPEGFVKTAEYTNIAMTYFKYENEMGEIFQITVGRDKALLQFDSIDDIYEVRLNEKGYEYTGTYRIETGKGTVIWQDSDDIYYYISGTAEYEELVKVMNGVTY